MGYGSRALDLLKQYYEGKMTSLEEEVAIPQEIDSIPDEEVGLLEEHIGL